MARRAWQKCRCAFSRDRLLYTVNPIKLETGLRPNSAGIPYTLLLRIEAIGFPTFRLLLYKGLFWCVKPSVSQGPFGVLQSHVFFEKPRG